MRNASPTWSVACKTVFHHTLKVRCELSSSDKAVNRNALDQIDRVYLRKIARIQWEQIVPAGRGASLEEAESFPVVANCHSIGMLTLPPDGDFHPCCGFHDNAAGLRIGTNSGPFPEP